MNKWIIWENKAEWIILVMLNVFKIFIIFYYLILFYFTLFQ